MPKVSEAYLEERRQQILDAAIVCFARNGFHQTTMEDIGQEAGMSPTVAYRYFDSKEDIIVATVQQSVNRAARLTDIVTDDEFIPLLFEQMVDDYFQRLEQPGKDVYYRVRVQLWAETLRNSRVADKARLLRNEALMKQAALIEMGQEQGQINPNLDAQTAAVAINASFDGFILHWLADPDIDIYRYREAQKMMIRGLFAHNE